MPTAVGRTTPMHQPYPISAWLPCRTNKAFLCPVVYYAFVETARREPRGPSPKIPPAWVGTLPGPRLTATDSRETVGTNIGWVC